MAISTFEADEVVARANVNQRINQANAYFPVSVANGGTGQTSLTSGNILLGNGTNPIATTATLPVSKGGTGKTSLSSGQILLGNGTNPITSIAVLPQSKGGTGVTDFYASGTWTPSIQNGADSYLSRSGMYYRIGGMVFVSCIFTVSGTSSSSNYGVVITGLPYQGDSNYYSCSVGEATGLTAEPVTATLYGSKITFHAAAKEGNYYPTVHLSNGKWATIAVSCWYNKS